MKNIRPLQYISIILITLIFVTTLSCEKEKADLALKMEQTDTLNFKGSVKSINSNNFEGLVSLQVYSDYYSCDTNFPFGRGAGKLLIDRSTLNFVDTLFFIIPAMYGPTFVLSGKYDYQFDGQLLTIWRSKETGYPIYELKLSK